MELPYVDNFRIYRYKFKKRHTVNSMITFDRPYIGYIVTGKGEFLYRGKTYFASEGDLIYIAKGTHYFSVWTGMPEVVFYSLKFKFSAPNEFDKYGFQIIKNYPQAAFDGIYADYCENSVSALGRLYFLLNDLNSRLQENKHTKAHDSVKPAVDYLEKHFTEKVYVEYLAGLCSLSPSRFYPLFKEATGCTPVDYKNALKVQKGMEYLSETDMTVEEIAEKLSFSSAAHFRKRFKEITGFSPKNMRK